MARKPVSELTTKELSKQKEVLTAIMLGAGVPLLSMAGYSLYMIIQEGSYFMLLTILGCILSIIPGFIGLNEINKEIRRRPIA
jgi:hypothetical protein